MNEMTFKVPIEATNAIGIYFSYEDKTTDKRKIPYAQKVEELLVSTKEDTRW